MPRLISFFLTTPQFLDGSKDVTRRMGWLHAKKGDVLEAVHKGQGIPKGQKVQRLGKIELVDVRQEMLDRMITDVGYGLDEVRREGFPDMKPVEFMDFFCNSHPGCKFQSVITRLEFKKL